MHCTRGGGGGCKWYIEADLQPKSPSHTGLLFPITGQKNPLQLSYFENTFYKIFSGFFTFHQYIN